MMALGIERLAVAQLWHLLVTLVFLSPGDNLQTAADSHPPFTQFYLSAGVYRLQEVSPKEGQQFIGELCPTGQRLAILSGARVLTGWVAAGGFWYVTGQTQEQQQNGLCEDPVCVYAEELFINGQHRTQVLSLGELSPGRWYFDYGQDRIYVAENPIGQIVETSVADRAFVGPADGVVVRNLVVEKYANMAGEGAIDPRIVNTPMTTGSNWIIENNEVRWNHGVGIRGRDGGLVQGNYIHHNGQFGVTAQGAGITFVNNEIAYNHFADFSTGWGAGGSKFSSTTDLLVVDNYVHHNNGPGLWSDVSDMRATYRGNRVEYNEHIGILYEVSYEGTIEGNLVIGNGFGWPDWGWGGGIVVSASSDVEVVDNIVIDNADGIVAIQQNRGNGPYGPHIIENLNVHGNCIKQQGGWTGGLAATGMDELFCCRNNRFAGNTYDLPNPEGNFLTWNRQWMGVTDWRTHHPQDGEIGTCDPGVWEHWEEPFLSSE